MITIPKLENVDLEPLWIDDIDHRLAMKHYLLFAKYDDKNLAILHPEHISDGLNHLARLGFEFDISETDIESYERLRNKFMELLTGNEFAQMQESTSEELFEAESDLLEFIQNSQDLL